jgi:RimJ/RimL family protein N-acetyltransferase
MSLGDIDAFLEIFSDPVAMKYFDVIFDRARMERWVRDNLEHQKEHGFSLMTLVLKDGGAVIGDCGLETTEIGGALRIGIGFDINRTYWNQGYATEAASAVVDLAFNSFDFANLSAWINPKNVGSRRVAEKIGMTVETSVERGGKPYVLYCITRVRWQNSRQP